MKTITLTSPDGTKVSVAIPHIRLVEPRFTDDMDPRTKPAGQGESRVYVAGSSLRLIVMETVEQIQGLIAKS